MKLFLYLGVIPFLFVLASCSSMSGSDNDLSSTPDTNLSQSNEINASSDDFETEDASDSNQDEADVEETENTQNSATYKSVEEDTNKEDVVDADVSESESYNPTTIDSRSVITMNMKAESQAELKARLTPLQFEVTQNAATEKPFSNPYDKNYEDGIYVDIVDGTPLFSSTTKFDSKTGWPSFSAPISASNIETPEDNTFFMKRTEVVGAKTDSHIGHLFDDGPESMGGLRYCLNSAALAFIPKDEMEIRGYGEYLSLFQ